MLALNLTFQKSIGLPLNDVARLADITAALQTVASTYIPINNPSFNGLNIQRSDIALSGIKFVGGAASGIRAIELETNKDTNNTAVFGQTTIPGEVAWEFSGNDDFCWTHSTSGKQFSINQNGATAKNLFIADFLTNDATGQRTVNSINVKDKLDSHDTTLATHSQQITDIISGTYTNDSGVIYSDTAPSGNIDDGALWFDSQNIRLNVRHQGAWIYPDRVEDTALKTALFNAVSTSTDFDTLKIKLLAALI